MNKDVKEIFRGIISDLRVDLEDEFKQNFEREAFFSEAWQRRKSPINSEYRILAGPQQVLLKSIYAENTDTSITFKTDLPYAEIHNDGGEIRVTGKMKGWFWHKYYESIGSFGRKKDGSLRRDKRNARITEESDFYRYMALKPVGSTITIPRRRFIGMSPEVEDIVRRIVEDNIKEYFDVEYRIVRK